MNDEEVNQLMQETHDYYEKKYQPIIDKLVRENNRLQGINNSISNKYDKLKNEMKKHKNKKQHFKNQPKDYRR